MKSNEIKNIAQVAFPDIISRLMQYYNLKQIKDLSEKLDVNYATFSTWQRRQKIPYELLINLAIKEKLSLDWLLSGLVNENLYGQNKQKNVIIDSFENKNHKNIDILAVEEHLKDKHYLALSQHIINKFVNGEKLDELKVVTVVGSSMSPTICNEDKVFIKLLDKDEEIYNSIIYLIVYKNRTYIKRIQVNPVNQKVRLISDNPQYETFEIKKEDLDDFKIIGRVLFKAGFKDII